MAPEGQAVTHSPHSLQMLMVYGLWQAMQSKLQPCRNTTNRLPGPSTLENVMVSVTRPWVAFMASDSLDGALAEVEGRL